MRQQRNLKLFAEAHQAKASHRINESLRFFRAFRVRKKEEKALRLCVSAFELFAFAI